MEDAKKLELAKLREEIGELQIRLAAVRRREAALWASAAVDRTKLSRQVGSAE